MIYGISKKIIGRCGFTLMELITVVIIIAILAALGGPVYVKTMERARDKEAIANLELAKAAEKIYNMEFQSYYPPDNSTKSDIDEINAELRLDLSNNGWSYDIVGAGGSDFTARAFRDFPSYVRTYQIDKGSDPQCSGNCP